MGFKDKNGGQGGKKTQGSLDLLSLRDVINNYMLIMLKSGL
jgi:hypothetical protein